MRRLSNQRRTTIGGRVGRARMSLTPWILAYIQRWYFHQTLNQIGYANPDCGSGRVIIHNRCAGGKVKMGGSRVCNATVLVGGGEGWDYG
jgi:hypothetical protein